MTSIGSKCCAARRARCSARAHLAGTVRYISNQPDLTDGYGDFEVGLSTISDGGDGGVVRGMVNVPLGDRAALRVVGYFNEVPGYIDAHGPGGVLDQNVNDGERQGGRLALRWELTENIAITPRVIYQDIDVNGYNREDAGTSWPTRSRPRSRASTSASASSTASSTSTSTTISSSAT